jgi:hypothetical protein
MTRKMIIGFAGAAGIVVAASATGASAQTCGWVNSPGPPDTRCEGLISIGGGNGGAYLPPARSGAPPPALAWVRQVAELNQPPKGCLTPRESGVSGNG